MSGFISSTWNEWQEDFEDVIDKVKARERAWDEAVRAVANAPPWGRPSAGRGRREYPSLVLP